MERPPQNHHAAVLEFLQACRHLVEFLHPAGVRFRAGCQQGVEVNVPVTQPAKRVVGCPGGVVKMRTDGHQSAGLPILDGRPVRRFRVDAPATGVVHAQNGRPMPGLVVNIGQQVQIRRVSKIGKLAGQQTFIRFCFEALDVLENRPGPEIGMGIGRVQRRATTGNQHSGEQQATNVLHSSFCQSQK